MFFRRITGAVAALTLVAGASAASAAIIPGLYNTGVDNAGVALAGGNGVVDPHYTIVSSTSGVGFAGQPAVTYFNGAYIPNSAASRWVSLSATGSPGSNTTIYRLSFSLAGLNPATAQLSGRWATDNAGNISLNGGAGSFASGTFQAYTAFSFNSGFVAGVNTLDFSVSDFGAPTAFRVDELRGTADLAGLVPEPGTWALMISGFGLTGLLLRRRSLAVAA